MKLKLLTPVLVAVTAFATIAAAHAESVILESDKTVMVNMADRPGTVVVGNPAIADVSINGKTIFLHGRGFGNTNIIVLDLKGEQIANFDVTIKQAQTDAVTIFSARTGAGAPVIRTSYLCAPTCESNLQIGDNADYFKLISEENKAKNELATGSKTAEAEAPSAAQ
jgi:Pilus formation protein N terminal region